jgi:hypothetical protein
MNHPYHFLWLIILEYLWNISKKNYFLNFLYYYVKVLYKIISKDMLFFKSFQVINEVFFWVQSTSYNVLKIVLHIFYALYWFQIYSHIPMIYYDFFCIKKSNNFNTKLNYHFKTWKNQAKHYICYNMGYCDCITLLS